MSELEIAYLDALRRHGVDPDAPLYGVEALLDQMRAAGAPDDIIEQLVERAPKTLKERYSPVLETIQREVKADAAHSQCVLGGEYSRWCFADEFL